MREVVIGTVVCVLVLALIFDFYMPLLMWRWRWVQKRPHPLTGRPYFQNIIWTTPFGKYRRVFTAGHESPEEAWRCAIRDALEAGWTPPKNWQFWRRFDTRPPAWFYTTHWDIRPEVVHPLPDRD